MAQPQNLTQVQELKQELKALIEEQKALERNIVALDKVHVYDQCKIFYNKGQKEQLGKQIAMLDEHLLLIESQYPVEEVEARPESAEEEHK
jgi:hypothetical protein